MYSCENVLLHASEYLLPSGKLFSSTLHTIILGFRDNRPDFLIRFLLNFFFNDSGFSPLFIRFRYCSKKFNSYSSKFFFLFFSNLFWRDSKSASKISLSTISISLTGSTVLLIFCIFSDSKQRATWTIASTSLIWERNLLPKPSPFEAPFTRPAISTKVIVVLIVYCDFDIEDILFSLSSGTATIPIFGSIVQKGKFSAWAFLETVNALNKVDLPTLGKPTIPHLKPIIISD